MEQSYELIPISATALSLAQAYRLQFFIDQDTRHLERAIALYRLYIDAVATGARRGDAVASLAELEPIKLRFDVERKQKAELVPTKVEPYEPPTQVMVVSAAPESRISLDGETATKAPLVALVTPGIHIARIEAPGYKAATREITAIEGRLVVVEVELKEEPAQVWFRGAPGAQVWLDGRLVARLPLRSPISVSAGKHRVYLTQKGRVPWIRSLSVERGGTLDVSVTLPIAVQRFISYGLLGAGTLGLVTAGVVGLMALQEEQEAVNIQHHTETRSLTIAERDQYESLLTARDTHATTAWLSFGISVAVTAAGSLLYNFSPSQSALRPESSWISLVPHNDGLGIGYGGRF